MDSFHKPHTSRSSRGVCFLCFGLTSLPWHFPGEPVVRTGDRMRLFLSGGMSICSFWYVTPVLDMEFPESITSAVSHATMHDRLFFDYNNMLKCKLFSWTSLKKPCATASTMLVVPGHTNLVSSKAMSREYLFEMYIHHLSSKLPSAQASVCGARVGMELCSEMPHCGFVMINGCAAHLNKLM